jgi:ADP-ribose pyrophosphatase
MIIPEVLSSTQPYKGLVTTIKLDTLTRGDGTTFVREVAMMTGAVAIAAVDELQRILLIRQYRHPMKRPMWEIPAGTMDVEGEPPALTAARELREEADLLAGHVELLTVFGNSVGRSTEMTHLYLAKDLEEAPEFERTNEEADIEKAWVPLPEALAMIKDGTIADAKTIIGILMASRG